MRFPANTLQFVYCVSRRVVLYLECDRVNTDALTCPGREYTCVNAIPPVKYILNIAPICVAVKAGGIALKMPTSIK